MNTLPLQTRITERLKKDLSATKNYLKACRKQIQEAATHNDDENLYLWASQYDTALQQKQAIEIQLNSY